jgi:predicted GIY-YIG superfamily endonuclease
MAWVYILRCRDGSYYVGSTTNLERRLAEHRAGTYDGYTSTRLPITLVLSYETTTRDQAFQLEMQIKGWSRRKKEALISGRHRPAP